VGSFSDNELMVRVAAGEVDCLGILFERYQKPLFNFFLRLVGRGGIAEDLVQEVFYRMLRYRTSFRDRVRFRMWLYRIAHNVGNDHFGKTEHLPIEERDMPANHVDPSDRLRRSEDMALLREALATLSHAKREVLLLSRFEGLAYREIAEITGDTVAAIKVRVHRAHKDLRRYFEAREQEATP